MPGRTTIYSSLVLCTVAAAACGGAPAEEASDAPMTETAAASELECFLRGSTFDETQQRPSPLRTIEIELGTGSGLLCYGAPSANGRDVMGSTLVPYGAPWRLGANEATALHLDTPATVGGVALQPGTYSLYVVAGESEWQFFVNTTWERWGIPIDAGVRSSEVGSFTATPEQIQDMVETLTFRFEPASGGSGGRIVMEWENTRVAFPVSAAG
jgi:hypothetical protein